MTIEQRNSIKSFVDKVRPEAKEIVAMLKAEPETTQHNYGLLMHLLSGLTRTHQNILLLAMIEEGYPAETARIVSRNCASIPEAL